MDSYQHERLALQRFDESRHWNIRWKGRRSIAENVLCRCGKPITSKRAKACSPGCAVRLRSASEKQCLHCGNQFRGSRSYLKRIQFCSLVCAKKHRRNKSPHPLNCGRCGTPIKFPRYYKKFCPVCSPLVMRERKQNQFIADRLRQRIIHALKGETKSASTRALLGCSFEQFRLHMESQFSRKMNWANYGSFWQIDHREPCASFDLSKPDQQRICFHFSNLQPLEAGENFKKRDRIVPTQRELLITL